MERDERSDCDNSSTKLNSNETGMLYWKRRKENNSGALGVFSSANFEGRDANCISLSLSSHKLQFPSSRRSRSLINHFKYVHSYLSTITPSSFPSRLRPFFLFLFRISSFSTRYYSFLPTNRYHLPRATTQSSPTVLFAFFSRKPFPFEAERDASAHRTPSRSKRIPTLLAILSCTSN